MRNTITALMAALLTATFALKDAAPERPASRDAADDPNLNAVLWMQTAAEYKASCLQTWRTAAESIDARLGSNDGDSTLEGRGAFLKPTAVIVDVDETVLDNSPYQARLIKSGESYSPESWAAWVGERNARPIPGALACLDRAKRAGVEIFYITNRDASLEEPTRANLERWGFPINPRFDVVLMKNEQPDWGSDKSSRRAVVTKDFRVLAVVGDDLGDFIPRARQDASSRETLVEQYAHFWGRRWFVLPNPSYGSFIRAAVGDEELAPKALNEAKRRALHLDLLPSEPIEEWDPIEEPDDGDEVK